MYNGSVIREIVRWDVKLALHSKFFRHDIKTIKQLLTNKDFCSYERDQEINFLCQLPKNYQSKCLVKIFNRNRKSDSYKTEQWSVANWNGLTMIITYVKVLKYYESPIHNYYVMQNKIGSTTDFKQPNVVSNYKCYFEDIKIQHHVDYIGFKTSTFSRYLTLHLSSH